MPATLNYPGHPVGCQCDGCRRMRQEPIHRGTRLTDCHCTECAHVRAMSQRAPR